MSQLPSNPYFQKLLELLNIERAEDLRSYRELTSVTSLADRRISGLCWYPVAIRNTEFGRGDYLSVEVERTTHQDLVHQFRFGGSVALFSNHDPHRDRIEGTVVHLNGNTMRVSFREDELPEWAGKGKLGMDLLFDDTSYDEMEKALEGAAELSEDQKQGHLIRVLTGQEQPAFKSLSGDQSFNNLNASQQDALHRILAAEDLAIVHGPPGTGKTTTLISAITALLQEGEKQILAVAPSNAAVDLLTEKLANEGVRVVRVGNPVRVSEGLSKLTLDSRMEEHLGMKEVRSFKKQANELRNMAQKYKRNFGHAEREQRKALFTEAHRILKDAGATEQFIMEDVLNKAQVITATLVGANHYTVRDRKYDTVVIDEAGQSLEPACWIPILKARKVVLAGDHFQLPPTIKSDKAAREGLAVTLLQKCAGAFPQAVVLLNEQYRMHEAIMDYPSRVFYNDRLKAHSSVAGKLLHAEDSPLLFVDTGGCGFEEKQEGYAISNPEEADFLFRHMEQYLEELGNHHSLESFPEIAVISPYKEQISVLKDKLLQVSGLEKFLAKIAVNTIDSFQGQEKDIVYISMTRSNYDENIGFLADIRRMNVAMTRARKKLVVIGDGATLSILPFYSDFISYSEGISAYKSAWEYL
ncbi:AAA domain-containing protein [Arcticibacter sp. MXS-1]|uniref:AAA domain-containing protein n=1 Tax=Arcticibacter sp. MXS-1 TaxID=3341726 RepID=UPI0035A8C268